MAGGGITSDTGVGPCKPWPAGERRGQLTEWLGVLVLIMNSGGATQWAFTVSGSQMPRTPRKRRKLRSTKALGHLRVVLALSAAAVDALDGPGDLLTARRDVATGLMIVWSARKWRRTPARSRSGRVRRCKLGVHVNAANSTRVHGHVDVLFHEIQANCKGLAALGRPPNCRGMRN